MKQDHFQLFVTISQQITSALESEEMISRCLQHLIKGFHSEAASIFLTNPLSGQTELFALSENNEKYTNIKLNRAEGIVGWVIENKKSLIVPDVSIDSRFTNRVDEISDFVTRSIMAVPLIQSGKCIGALEVLNPISNEFSEADLEFCETVASQLSIVIRNLNLFKETQKLLKDIKNLDKMKSSFISMASHELLTPLTKIKLQTQLLSTGEDKSSKIEQRTVIEKIEAYIDQLTHIARDLTNMNLLESDLESLKFFKANLNHILQKTIEEISDLCKKRHLSFSTHLAEHLPETSLDRRLISVLVRNLLLNAIRFTPNKGEISLTTRVVGPDIEIVVADTGIGIAIENQQRIFQPLYEVQDSTYHHSGTIEFKSGGLGLGLPIARHIVIAHKGRIWVESEQGKGSRFIVHLPIGY